MDRLFCFFAIAECRVHDANSLQVRSQAAVSCSQPEYSGLLMSCQTVDWVSARTDVPGLCRGFPTRMVLYLKHDKLYSIGWKPWILYCGRVRYDCLLVGWLLSVPATSGVSQGRICTDNCTCYHTEVEAADQTFYLTQSKYTDTRPTSPSADPRTPGA